MAKPDSAPVPLTADDVIALLELRPLPGEGGYFRETYRSEERIAIDALPPRYQGPGGRSHSTQIYFLITPSTPSRMHVVASDEVFHHYFGDSVEQLHLTTAGQAGVVTIGPDLARGERPQVVVPRGVWQGCRVRAGGRFGYALLGCTVSPGFDWTDFQIGGSEQMRRLYRSADPAILELIDALGAEVGA